MRALRLSNRLVPEAALQCPENTGGRFSLQASAPSRRSTVSPKHSELGASTADGALRGQLGRALFIQKAAG